MNNLVFISIKWLSIIVLNVKLSNSQLDKIKSALKNKTEIVLRLPSNMIVNSNDKTSFIHKLSLTNGQAADLRKSFANNLSTDTKLSKTQLSKMTQTEGFIDRLFGPLLKRGIPLMKNVMKPLAKSVLIPLRLTAGASAADAGFVLSVTTGVISIASFPTVDGAPVVIVSAIFVLHFQSLEEL